MAQTGFDGGYTGMLAGLTMVTAGIVLTVSSYQSAPPGGMYVVFVGLIAGGLYRVVASMVTPRVIVGRAGGFAHAAPDAFTEYYVPPHRAPESVCWQCGAPLRKTAPICYACGATRPVLRTHPPLPAATPHVTPDEWPPAAWSGALRGPQVAVPTYRPGGDYSPPADIPLPPLDLPLPPRGLPFN